MSHEGWLELTKWFVGRYKGESEDVSLPIFILHLESPADSLFFRFCNQIAEEKVIFAHRPHPALMEATDDRVGRPLNSHRVSRLRFFSTRLIIPLFPSQLLSFPLFRLLRPRTSSPSPLSSPTLQPSPSPTPPPHQPLSHPLSSFVSPKATPRPPLPSSLVPTSSLSLDLTSIIITPVGKGKRGK